MKLVSPLKRVYGGVIAGGDVFVKKVVDSLEDMDLDKVDISNRRELKSRYSSEEIIKKVSMGLNVSTGIIVNSEKKEYRAIAVYLMKRYTSLTNKEIGRIFGNLSYSGVSKVNRRFEEKMKSNRILKMKVEKIMSNVKG